MSVLPYELPLGRVLILPDVHMDVAWVRAALAQEADNWDHPALPPQIVGHTQDKNGLRWNGRSACIDGGQTCWALLDASGNLSVRYLAGRS